MKTYKWFFLILAAGVFTACSNDSEEPLLGNWTIMSTMDGSDRGYAASFVLHVDGKEYGYVCGGRNAKNRFNDVWRYDCELNRWTGMESFPDEFQLRSQAVGFACRGKGYVGTGWDGKENVMKDFWEFDPSAGTKGKWEEVAPLPDEARERHSAVAFTLSIDGKEYGYVGTGYTEGEIPLTLKDFWKFDPEGTTIVKDEDDNVLKEYRGSWELEDGNPGNKRWGASAFVINNKAYICAGYSNSSRSLARDLLEFDPNTSGKWVEKRRMYDAEKDQDYDDDYLDLGRAFAASFVMLGGDDGKEKGYLAVGVNKSTVWEYDPIEDLWEQRTTHYNNEYGNSKEGATAFSFPNAIHPAKGTLGRGFVCLGFRSGNPSDDNREFFPREEDNIRDDDK